MNTHTVEELYRLAQQGNTEALTRLGICYKNGTGTAVDHSAAAQCFYSAANAGNAEAQYQLGICYEEGIGLEQDLSAAGYWFQEAARRFYEAAQVGNPQAQYGLANCYAEGRGVEKDEAAAVYWYQASAQQDYADAQYNLGYCFLFGIGVEANEIIALKWYSSAASHGDPQMQHNLGLIYKNGYGGVSKNYGKAAEWFFKAARQCYSESKVELAQIYFRNPLAVKDISIAERLMTEAAEEGNTRAQEYLVHYYFDQDAAKYDLKKACRWASECADSSDPTVAVVLGISFANGEVAETDDKQAFEWLSKAKDQEKKLNGEACYYLGKFYEEGNVTEKSLDDAEHFYKLAVRKHFANGSESLERIRREKEEIRKAEEAKALEEQKEAEELKKQEEVKQLLNLKPEQAEGDVKSEEEAKEPEGAMTEEASLEPEEAKSEEVDKITGLNIGADDYVTKPFTPMELMARVNSQLRRYRRFLEKLTPQENVHVIGGLEINEDTVEVTMDGNPVKLTPIEYKILLLLAKNPGRVFSSEEIYERVWQEKAINTDTIMVHVRNIREKIEIDPKKPKYLKVVWGVGYKLEKQP